jgi:enoyl-CoA hydratase/carnithine racemase
VGNLSRLCHLIGAAKTRELLLMSTLMGAEDAKQCGLLNEITADPYTRAQQLAADMQHKAPLTIAATKEALRRIREQSAAIDDADLIVKCYTSADFREGLEAFLAKREPRWQGN